MNSNDFSYESIYLTTEYLFHPLWIYDNESPAVIEFARRENSLSLPSFGRVSKVWTFRNSFFLLVFVSYSWLVALHSELIFLLPPPPWSSILSSPSVVVETNALTWEKSLISTARIYTIHLHHFAVYIKLCLCIVLLMNCSLKKWNINVWHSLYINVWVTLCVPPQTLVVFNTIFFFFFITQYTLEGFEYSKLYVPWNRTYTEKNQYLEIMWRCIFAHWYLMPSSLPLRR